MKKTSNWIVAYDIADKRRLGRVHRAVTGFAVPLQYSVYWARLDPESLRLALQAVAERIEARFDDVRFYPLPENPTIYRLGRAILPDGIRLSTPGFDHFQT